MVITTALIIKLIISLILVSGGVAQYLLYRNKKK